MWIWSAERQAHVPSGFHRPDNEKRYLAGLPHQMQRRNIMNSKIKYEVISRIWACLWLRLVKWCQRNLQMLFSYRWKRYWIWRDHDPPEYQEWIIAKRGKPAVTEERDWDATVRLMMVEYESTAVFVKNLDQGTKDNCAAESDYARSLSAG